MTGTQLEKIHLQYLVFYVTKSDVIGNVQSWRQNLKFQTLPRGTWGFTVLRYHLALRYAVFHHFG